MLLFLSVLPALGEISLLLLWRKFSASASALLGRSSLIEIPLLCVVFPQHATPRITQTARSAEDEYSPRILASGAAGGGGGLATTESISA